MDAGSALFIVAVRTRPANVTLKESGSKSLATAFTDLVMSALIAVPAQDFLHVTKVGYKRIDV